MRVYKNAGKILLLFLTAGLLVQSASGLLVHTSSYYDGYTIFDGNLDNGKYAKVMIEFAVYERSSGEFDGVFSGVGLTAPGTGEFIYAYKVFNHSSSEDMISAFSILGLDEQANAITGLDALDDGEGGAEPTNGGQFEEGNCVWKWFEDESSGMRFIELGDQSWLLVFSSNNPWKPGEYKLTGTDESDFPSPDGQVPEPVTVALLGAGGAFLLKRKNREV